MFISRTPLRISLGGGGTDLPAYYRNNGGGFLVAAAIDKYIHVAINDPFTDRYILKYSQMENVASAADIQHPLIREALLYTDTPPGIEISSVADLPAGTGLGSSGTFAVGLLKALRARSRKYAPSETIAQEACHLEIDRLREPVGKQDQYIAAIGGITAFEFHDDDSVSIHSVDMDRSTRESFEDHLMLFYTGVSRSASDYLRALDEQASMESSAIRTNLNDVRDAGREAFKVLQQGDLSAYGHMLTEQWKLKFARSPSAIHAQVDNWIAEGIAGGAAGGKLVGAGGGGFLLFLARDKQALRATMRDLGLPEVPMGIDYRGTTVSED